MYKLHRENYGKLEKKQLAAGEQTIAENNIQRGSFWGDSLSQLIFVIAIMPQNYIPRKCNKILKVVGKRETASSE